MNWLLAESVARIIVALIAEYGRNQQAKREKCQGASSQDDEESVSIADRLK